MPTILIVEDQANIRMFIAVNLEARGYHVLEAETGGNGLHLLQQHTPSELILDMMLPDMEGWDVLDAMAQHPLHCNVPVILMTASVNVTPPQNRRYSNLAARLEKPTSVQDLIQTVARVTGE